MVQARWFAANFKPRATPGEKPISGVVANGKSIFAPKRLDDKSAGVTADGDGPVLMRVKQVRSDLAIPLPYFFRWSRLPLTRHDHAWPRPPCQLRRVR
jgi:hypothetical protein